MLPTDTPDAPTANLTYVDKRVFCKLRDTNVILMLGLANKDVRVPPEIVRIATPVTPIVASLISVTPKLVEYRQVMKEGAGGTFDPAQK